MTLTIKQVNKFFPEDYTYPKGWRNNVEERLNKLLTRINGGTYLEIGLGPIIRQERTNNIINLNISYTGLDFSDVCKMHLNYYKNENINHNFQFITNNRGNYLYNLIKLNRNNEKFDLIYLDGHHTMYIDFAAAMACLPLLKSGSYFAFDDVRWNLFEKEVSLKSNEFYQTIYDFDLYEDDEKKDRHIGIIIKDYLLPYYNLSIVEELSCPGWIVLQVGENWPFDK